ncbi:integral membrane protein-like protein [Aaosphaeria arxii CBS 175.79]|uniref:Integral membrane protein-like protein n=1 Tax=Aaosphaeria arxii CBS 175.79 TaxID=1450172 RepID=A0A6A5XQT9_9PLEO|nr:integral membrane protein-like protein [Aaosphaeria arxii CBS 175.79]KAF2014664.1 integral membrane protein-like protein [Aaosphaeria arxii CBS 175.79]
MNSRLIAIVVCLFTILGFYKILLASSRDPTSLFFNPRVGYAPRYSAVRKAEAGDFISDAPKYADLVQAKDGETERKLCVGIPSIARKDVQYLQTAVGSLIEGLTPQERAEIFLIVFIPHSDPTVHPSYAEQWLPDLTDEVLVYNVTSEQTDHIKQLESEGGEYREKGLYDYTYLLQECISKRTPHIAMLEDDTVAMDGWYHRTMAAIDEAEALSAERRALADFLYLRLFYTEEFLGYNSEDWATYLFYSTLAFGFPLAVLLYLRHSSAPAKRILTNRTLATISAATIACIALFFLLGRCTMLPLPAGVNEMPAYGCCSQGLVFPRNKAMTLAKYLTKRRLGFVDVIIEEYANQNDELRWAITPSVLQHVGRKSSKLDDYGPASKWGMSVAEKIWSFGFERFDRGALREEHLRVAASRET